MDEAQLVAGGELGGEDIEPVVGKAPGHGWRLSVSDFTIGRLTRYAIAQYTEVQPEAIETFTLSAISPNGHEFSMERTFVDVLGVLGAEG